MTETDDGQQWVVVCLDPEYGAPVVYAAWDTESEAATWLDEDHLTESDTRSGDVPQPADLKWCANDASELDHYVVPVVDCT